MNFTALLSRFQTTCWSRAGSAQTWCWSAASSSSIATPLASASARVTRAAARATACASVTSWCSSIFPRAIRVRSSRSSISRASICTFRRIVDRSSRTAAGRSAAASRWVTAASTGVSGVRSSCDSTAKNWSFARLARSASSRAVWALASSRSRSAAVRACSASARARWASACFTWVMSRRYPVNSGAPSSGMRTTASSAGNADPSARAAVTSTRLPSSGECPVRAHRASAARRRRRSTGGNTRSAASRPTAWSRRCPNVCSAAGFHSTTRPVPSIVTMQSSAARRTAALRASLAARAVSARLRGVMSLAIAQTPYAAPAASRSGNLTDR
ncbi:MAG: hypothetical protein AVDCRST_MAG64-3552 [uncultured Phycisphaerae bacterium]|uniref:Uncharacterized protein n=1 Tax=uncultured Phycisphaerae bacterium TaxID=904963 RepID=A0A6J4Q4N7_9BACT|nr:MAG: hypothetical protein AVDCRST_MAG64-3552 [uncultured Phycisphaerae bacterium]